MERDNLTGDDALVWAAYHALRQPLTKDPPALCALLPLFNDDFATPAMIRHGVNIQRQATTHLNPGQIPVAASIDKYQKTILFRLKLCF